MRELFFKLDCHFLDSEKEQCKPTIFKLLELANIARQKGIIDLEIEISREQNLFLKTAAYLVIDGRDPALIKQILQSLILADKYSGAELLNRLLVAEGVLAIQQGENPEIIALMLYSMLGEKYLHSAEETLSAVISKILGVHRFIGSLKDQTALPESEQFEKIILQMHDKSIQVALYDTNENGLLMALYGCGIDVIQKVLTNISTNRALRIAEDWALMKPLCNKDIQFYQKEILKKIDTLRLEGEIIV